eukprot:318020-Alexandrium_andersonii.AAC.2
MLSRGRFLGLTWGPVRAKQLLLEISTSPCMPSQRGSLWDPAACCRRSAGCRGSSASRRLPARRGAWRVRRWSR